MRVVLYSNELGVYLGSCMGLGFWSKLDPVGQTSACTFADETEALAFVGTWDHQPEGIRCVPVEPDDNGHASARACERAGLPNWLM